MGIDFRKLSRYIIILGAVFLAYGGIRFVANQPVDASYFRDQNSPRSSNGAFSWTDFTQRTFGAGIQAHDENLRRSQIRGEAVFSMIVGGILAFVGYSVSNSAKTNSEPVPSAEAARQEEQVL